MWIDTFIEAVYKIDCGTCSNCLDCYKISTENQVFRVVAKDEPKLSPNLDGQLDSTRGVRWAYFGLLEKADFRIPKEILMNDS